MKAKHVVVLCLLLLVATGTVFAGGGKESGAVEPAEKETVEITLWHMENIPARVEILQGVIDSFNAQNPEVRVKQEVQDWTTAREKIMAAIRAKSAPEIFFTIPDLTLLLRETGALVAVDDIFAELDKKYRFQHSALKPYQGDGHYWAVPTYSMVKVMWYRKDLYRNAGLDPEDPPKTWNELLDYTKTISSTGVHGIGVPASKHMDVDQEIYTFMVTNKAEDVFDAEGNVSFNNPRTVDAFRYYKELVNYSPSDVTSWGWAEPEIAFTQGITAMDMAKGQFVRQYDERTDLPPENLGVTPVPWPEDGQRGSLFYPNGLNILTEDAVKQEAIKQFLMHLYDPEVYGNFVNMEVGLFVPITETSFDSKTYWENPLVAKYSEQVKVLLESNGYGRLFGFTQEKVNKAIGSVAAQMLFAQGVQKMVIDNWSPEEAVAWVDDKMREIAVQ